MGTQRNTALNYMSGHDAVLFLNGVEVGTIQALSWTTQREKVMNYALGNGPRPIGVSRGKRAHGGSLVNLSLHGENLDKAIGGWILTNSKDTERASLQKYYESIISNYENSEKKLSFQDLNPGDASVIIGGISGHIQKKKVLAKAWHKDQLPPFDIMVLNTNEHGASSVCILLNVEFVNQGTSVSIDDINIAETLTFICTGVTNWEDVTKFVTVDQSDSKTKQSAKSWLLENNIVAVDPIVPSSS